ncbi:hypothetical protein L6452_05660 [Arctium lappa]|uniref:Uncharacterized protein n=1 Tax=Arctium lappa TaxID=4217 RepID=A0ACB9EI29_ARCLA|nr:hypothetical protein L6452_05660 [Arctium lappa]
MSRPISRKGLPQVAFLYRPGLTHAGFPWPESSPSWVPMPPGSPSCWVPMVLPGFAPPGFLSIRNWGNSE